MKQDLFWPKWPNCSWPILIMEPMWDKSRQTLTPLRPLNQLHLQISCTASRRPPSPPWLLRPQPQPPPVASPAGRRFLPPCPPWLLRPQPPLAVPPAGRLPLQSPPFTRGADIERPGQQEEQHGAQRDGQQEQASGGSGAGSRSRRAGRAAPTSEVKLCCRSNGTAHISSLHNSRNNRAILLCREQWSMIHWTIRARRRSPSWKNTTPSPTPFDLFSTRREL